MSSPPRTLSLTPAPQIDAWDRAIQRRARDLATALAVGVVTRAEYWEALSDLQRQSSGLLAVLEAEAEAAREAAQLEALGVLPGESPLERLERLATEAEEEQIQQAEAAVKKLAARRPRSSTTRNKPRL